MATTNRLLKQREVITKKTVTDVFEVPTIDFSVLRMEIANNGCGSVYLNGVLLKGVSLSSYELRDMRDAWRSYSSHGGVDVLLCTPRGERLKLYVDEMVFIEGDVPSGAKLIETLEEPKA